MSERFAWIYDEVRGVKTWVADMWARRRIIALQAAIADLSSTPISYGYCTTAAGTVAKTVTVSPAITAMDTGTTIAIKFQYANTASNPTLNVNGLGAKAIKRYGTTAAGTSAAANWNANSVVMLTYDGTYWMLVDWNNTTYSGMTDAEYQAGTGTTNRLITPARLKAAIELHAPVQSVNGQTGAVTVAVPTKTSDLTNDSGFLTSAPVTSVNNKTGAVSLTASDVGALPSTTVIPSKTSDLTNDSGFIKSAPVTSVNGQTGAVTVPSYYGTCDTAAETAAKTVTCAGFTLVTGAKIAVRFTNAQLYNATNSSPISLNVNATGAIPAMRIGTTAVPRYAWQGDQVVEFVYDGTNYIMVDGGLASVTYYGITRLSASLTSTSTNLALTASAGKELQDQITALAARVTALESNN